MKLQRPSSRLKFHEQSTLLGSTVFFFSNVVVCSNFTDSVQNYFYSFDNVWNENYFHNCFRLSTNKKKSSDCWDRVSRNRRNFFVDLKIQRKLKLKQMASKRQFCNNFFSSNHFLAWFYFFRHIFFEQGVHFCFDVVLHHLRRVTKIYWHWWFFETTSWHLHFRFGLSRQFYECEVKNCHRFLDKIFLNSRRWNIDRVQPENTEGEEK